MEDIVLYGSQYGHARQYAQALAHQTGIPALPYQSAPDLSGRGTIVYLGGLYAGGVLGLAKTLRGLSLREGQRLFVVTVGVADPEIPKNREHLRISLRRQLSPALFDRAEIFSLRGGIDYRVLSLRHRLMMAVLCRSLRNQPAEQRSAEEQALLETYGGQVDFTDLRALEPLVRRIRQK